MNPLSRRDFTKNSLAALTPIVACSLRESSLNAATWGQSPKRIRVGQIGTKHGHATGKLEAVKKLSEHFEVVGVVEDDTKQQDLIQKSETFVNLPWMNMDQLLKQPGLQLVMVETDIDQLLPVAEKCLSAGMHIHLDKPAGASLDHFRRVAKIAAEKRRIIQMGYMFRSNSAFQFIYEAVKQGWLGEIFEIHGVMSKKIGTNERAELARYRGGSMFELGCHLIDAVVTLLGKPQTIVPINRNTHPELDQLNDNCLAIFQYPKATVSIRSSVVEVDGNRRRQFVVCGTLGTIAIEPLEPPRLTLTLDQPRGDYLKGTQVVELPKMTGRYDGDLLSLASAIRGESNYAYSLEHDLVVQECVLQASEML
ncbi:MAG TPA: Gfo/Idh/MocA family oxidoreductase [Pirellula sp.]|nr:Gfo/Idh/MocA family oxidoreductase [Pirellula sp.]